MAQDPKAETEKLRSDIAALKSDVANLTETLSALASDLGQEGVEAMRRASRKTQAQVADAAQTLEKQISERPYSSILVAFGLGFLMGKMMERR